MNPNWETQFHSRAEGPALTYRALDELQRGILARVLGGGAGALLLAEVEPVITCGRRTISGDILLSGGGLKERGIDLLSTDRGGLATYHGPGQWILFPVERLEVLTGDRRGVRKAVEGLLGTALDVIRPFDAEARIEWGDRTGVWGRSGKYASVGIHVAEGVLLHGMALNVYRTSQSFVGLRPCGLDAAPAFLAESSGGREFFPERGEASALRARFAEIGTRLAQSALKNFAVSRS